MIARPNQPGVPKKQARKSIIEAPPHNPNPDFNYEGLVHRGLKPPPRHPDLKFRGPVETQEWPTKGKKVYRSDTGGTMKVLKGSMNPSKRKQK